MLTPCKPDPQVLDSILQRGGSFAMVTPAGWPVYSSQNALTPFFVFSTALFCAAEKQKQ
jgi:hypothetical protein